MRHLDLADLVAVAAEVSGVDTPKLLELLDTAEITDLLDGARPPVPAHEAAAKVLAGLVGIGPLPAGNRRLALLAALHLLAINGLDVPLDPPATHALLAGPPDAASVAGWLDGRVTARDPLDGELRARLAPDAWRAVALAVQRARRHRRPLAGPDDMLMGLFREGTGPAAVALGAGAGSIEVVTSLPHPPVPAFEPATRKVFELAMRAATTLGHPQINGGHLLIALLDAGHKGTLPDDLSAVEIRRQILDLLGPGHTEGSDPARRLRGLADRIRPADPGAGAELDEIAALLEGGLDDLVEMIRTWRGDVFLQALAGEDRIARLLGHRLGAPAGTPDERLLADYLRDVARYPPLGRDEEVQLAQSMRTAPEREAAMSQRRMIQANLQLVVRIARKYQATGVPLLDLIQEGNLGLMRAVERYDPAKGYRFATFAAWWIRHRIQRAVGRRP